MTSMERLVKSKEEVGQTSTSAFDLQVEQILTSPAPKRARPLKVLGRSHQSSPHRIIDHIPLDSPELLPRWHQVIVALVLPKRRSSSSKSLVGAPCRIPLQPLQAPRHLNMRRHQHVNVVRHNHPIVQFIVGLGTERNRFANQCRDTRHSEIQRPAPAEVQNTVHAHEDPPRVHSSGGERASWWQAAEEVKRQEKRLANGVHVRQPAAGGAHSENRVPYRDPKSQLPTAQVRPTYSPGGRPL
jgi:hypothetical protein